MRVSVLAGVLCFLLVAVGNADPASAAIRRSTNIPAQPLDLALKTLAKERQFQVLFRADIVRDLRSGAAVGEFTSDEALKQLLSGTGLSYKYLDANTVTVFAAGASTSPGSVGQSQTTNSQDNQKEAGKKSSQDFRVAQVDQGTTGPSAVDKNNEKESDSNKKSAGLEEIVVTGSRIPLAADQQTAQPVQIYTREDISRSGQTTIADFLNTLPDVSMNNVEGDFQSFLGRTTVQLHGLPAGTTLTLLNGREIESSAAGYFDLGNIPASAMERIEVLPVGSSAVYGSDALAGAVNMILRKDFNGLEVDTKYGRATGTGEDDFSVAWGKTWDRGSISLVANYQGRTELSTNDRSITSTTNVPAAASFLLTDSCSPGTVYSLTGQPLPGLGTATEAGIPAGVVGRPTLQAFQATAGKINQCNVYANYALIPETQRAGALLSGHYEISPSADLFTEILSSHEFQANATGNAIALYGGSYGYTTIGAGNPYNPFGTEVGVSYAYPGIRSSYNNWQTFVRPLVGIRGSLGQDWKYEVTTLLSQDQSHDQDAVINQTSLQAALNSTNPATALNPFDSRDPGSPQLLQSLLNQYSDSFRNQLVSTQAIIRGTLFNLPSGPLQTVLGAQFDHEQLSFALNDYYQAPSALDLGRHSYALFTEERVPLLANHLHPESGEQLALSLAGRYDKYSDFGGKTTGQAGLEWRPRETLLLRAAYATSYKAPELQEISGSTSSFAEQISDPFRGNSTYAPLVESGPNSKLQPETGSSRVFGVVYDSSEYPGLKASLSFFSIDITNYISPLSAQVLVDYPNLFPGAVTRAPPTPQDQQLGYLGVITNIEDLFYNYGDIRVAGIDFDLSHRLQTRVGDFKPSLAITDMVRYRAALTPGAPDVSYLNQATLYGPGFTPRWKGTAALGWELGPLSTSLSGRYIGSYRDYQDIVPNTNELGNTWYCDFNVHYDLSKALTGTDRWYHHSYVELGAVNMLNNLPKFSYSVTGYDYAESDIRGRFVYAQIVLKL
jgi:iron complex outermembrane recepter protein